jgi:hypothetical protein
MMTPTHLNDDELLALADASLAEDVAAAARDHLVACTACAARATAHATLLQRLSGLALATDVARAESVARMALDASRRPGLWQRVERQLRHLSIGRVAFAGVACAGLLLVLPSTESRPDADGAGFRARGGAGALQDLQIFAVDVDDPDARPSPLRDGAIVSGATGLAVAVNLLPASAAVAVAVFAQETSGRVTWLAPAWDPSQPAPACIPVDRLPTRIAPPVAVAPPPATGALRTGLIISRGACALAPLDAHLETGAPLPPDVTIVRGPTLQLR